MGLVCRGSPYQYVGYLHTTRGWQATRKYLEKAPRPPGRENYAHQRVADHLGTNSTRSPSASWEELSLLRTLGAVEASSTTTALCASRQLGPDQYDVDYFAATLRIDKKNEKYSTTLIIRDTELIT